MASEEYLGTDAMHELLAAWSDVFAAMFRNECREQIEKKNVISDFSAAAVDCLLR